jgi:hypothetical protein
LHRFGPAFWWFGILDGIKDKTRYAALAVGGELVAKDQLEMGFSDLAEVPKGVSRKQ